MFHTKPELESPHIARPSVKVCDEQARLQAAKGRLDTLQTILVQLSSSLNSLNETHIYVANQVRDLEAYIGALVPTNVVSSVRSPAAAETKVVQRHGWAGGKFWSKLHLNFVRITCLGFVVLPMLTSQFSVDSDVLHLVSHPSRVLSLVSPFIILNHTCVTHLSGHYICFSR